MLFVNNNGNQKQQKQTAFFMIKLLQKVIKNRLKKEKLVVIFP